MSRDIVQVQQRKQLRVYREHIIYYILKAIRSTRQAKRHAPPPEQALISDHANIFTSRLFNFNVMEPGLEVHGTKYTRVGKLVPDSHLIGDGVPTRYSVRIEVYKVYTESIALACLPPFHKYSAGHTFNGLHTLNHSRSLQGHKLPTYDLPFLRGAGVQAMADASVIMQL